MTALLEVSHLARRYGRRRVLTDVSFVINEGEAIGLIGPNGAGKTTMLRIVAGLQRAESGEVRWRQTPCAKCSNTLAYFAGGPTIPPGVRARNWRALFHDVEPASDGRPVRELSSGSRQLLGLRTLFALPRLQLIALDEPWEGLDPDAARWLSDSIRSRRDGGAAVLVSSHRLHDLADVCDRFVFLDGGVATVVASRDDCRGRRLTADALLARFDQLRGAR